MPKDINLVIVDVETGLAPSVKTKKVIYESFKARTNLSTDLEKFFNKDKLGFYELENQKKILRFY